MATNTITVKGYIKDGQLQVDLPETLPDGEVEVTIAISEQNQEGQPSEFKGLTLGEILESGLVGSGADWDIGDSEEWVREQRRKRRERRQARWTDS